MCFDIWTINIRVSIRVRGLHLVLCLPDGVQGSKALRVRGLKDPRVPGCKGSRAQKAIYWEASGQPQKGPLRFGAWKFCFFLCLPEGVQGSKGPRVQGSKGSRVQGFKDSRVQGSKAPRVQGFKLQGCKGSKIQGFKPSSFQASKLPGFQASKHPASKPPSLQASQGPKLLKLLKPPSLQA